MSCLVEGVFLVFLGKTEFSHVVSGVSLQKESNVLAQDIEEIGGH